MNLEASCLLFNLLQINNLLQFASISFTASRLPLNSNQSIVNKSRDGSNDQLCRKRGHYKTLLSISDMVY